MRVSLFSLFLIFFSANFLVGQNQGSTLTEEELLQKKYDKNIRKSRINGVYIPKNIEEVFEELNRLSPPESIEQFKNAGEETIKSRLHFGLGRWMIYNWNFYEGSRISHVLKEMGISFPDDMARFLIVSYHRYLNGKELELQKRAETYSNSRQKEQLDRETKGTIIKEEKRKRNNN